MERFFRFTEHTSDKFWEIEFSDISYTVFFGRVGSAGRVETKTFSHNSECIKEADKQINSKIKKGYFEVGHSNRPVKDADTLNDIREFEAQWDLKVSPISKTLMNQSFFWSCIEETSPFGSDEGSDIFSALKDAFQENPRTKPLDYLRENFEDKTIYPLKNLNLTDAEAIISDIGDGNLDYVIMQDNAIWAIAFGQFVIRGAIDEDLKLIALNS